MGDLLLMLRLHRVLAPFCNPAREDDLVLQHWVPENEAKEAIKAAQGQDGDGDGRSIEITDVDGILAQEEEAESSAKGKLRALPAKCERHSQLVMDVVTHLPCTVPDHCASLRSIQVRALQHVVWRLFVF